MFPPLLGNNTRVSQGELITPSKTLPANPTASTHRLINFNHNFHIVFSIKPQHKIMKWKILNLWILLALTCSEARRSFHFDPIVRFNINRTVEEFGKDCHSRVIMKGKRSTSGEAKHAYLLVTFFLLVRIICYVIRLSKYIIYQIGGQEYVNHLLTEKWSHSWTWM